MSNITDFDDQTYLARAKRFDRNALAAIYDTYHPHMYRYIVQRVENSEIARDLTADLFKRFLQSVKKGSPPIVYLRAWLYRSAHNLVVDYYRRRKHRQHLMLDEQIPGTDPEPFAQTASLLQADAVRAAMRHLTPDQQQVITLKFLVGLSNSETADIMQKPVSAVKSLQHRALASLRRLLQPIDGKMEPCIKK